MLSGPCPHKSVPVEMDESMTSSSLNLAWPPSCQQCSGDTESSKKQQDQGCVQSGGVDQWRRPEDHHQLDPRVAPEPYSVPQIHPGQMKPPNPVGVLPHTYRETPYVRAPFVDQRRGFVNWPQEHSVEEAESLERPLPLMSDIPYHVYSPPHPAAGMLYGK